MPLDRLFPDLPADARFWAYAAPRALTPEQQQRLLDHLAPTLGSWTSHGRAVEGRAVVFADRFLLVAGHVAGGEISGCGIDQGVRAVTDAAAALGFEWQSPLYVYFRDPGGAVTSLGRRAFREAARAGEVTPETSVFDLSLSDVGAARAAFERPARASWHRRLFPADAPAG